MVLKLLGLRVFLGIVRTFDFWTFKGIFDTMDNNQGYFV